MVETSIVIRAFNEEKYIGKLLRQIRAQNYNDFEIMLVDSGSTDKTVAIAESYCDCILQIQSCDFTFGYSLNYGCRNARGKYIVIVSAHCVPTDTKWLQSLLAPFMDPRVAMVYGRHIGAEETKFSEKMDFARMFDDVNRRKVALPFYANNANSAIRKELWESHPFDEYLTGLEDIAWAKYFAERSHAVVYEPGASVYHIHEESWHQVYNRYRREAVASKHIGLAEPPHGSGKLDRAILWGGRDLIASISELSYARVKGIALFRYYQWLGSRRGLRESIDLQQERYDLYYSGVNRGVVISGRREARLDEIPMPEVRPGDVLVEVSHVGVCRTDLEIYDQELGYYKNGFAKYPIVPGHEFSGVVARVGANGGQLRVGDPVVGECIVPCGMCVSCSRGKYGSCRNRYEVGVVNKNGAYARFVSLPASRVHVIPGGMTLKEACLIEPLAVVRKGMRRILPRIESEVAECAVVGAGPIGNLCAQTLCLLGHKVTVYDIRPERLRYLGERVATKEKMENLENFGLIVEATGKREALKRVLAESAPDSTILLLGFPYGEQSYNFEDVVAQDRIIVGSVGSSTEDFSWALRTLPQMDLKPFLETILPLEDYLKAWEIQRSGSRLKVILNVSRQRS